MEQQGDRLDQEKVSCSICQDLLKNPVINPCGHSYCKSCIKDQNKREIYGCSQCRKTFRSSSLPVKNIKISQDLKKAELQAAPSNNFYAGPEDVACDFCKESERKRKADKFCQQCLASYCKQHLQPHYEVVPLKKHKLVEASATLQNSICSRHVQLKTIFCRTDKEVICSNCALEQHKDHDHVIAEAEITKRQKMIEASRQKFQDRIQEQEKDIELLQQELQAIDHSADQALNDSKEMSTELIQLIDEKKSELEAKIKKQKRYEKTRAQKLQDELKQKVTELKEKDAELERLSHTENRTELLSRFAPLSCLRESTISPSIQGRSVQHFKDVTTAISDSRRILQVSCSKKWKKILTTVSEVDVLLPQDPKTRAELLQYAVDKNDFKLDPNTAHFRMILSNKNRRATCKRELEPCDTSPGRFLDKSQVLSVQSLTGRCYFEVQWSGMSVSIAVAYKDIARAGEGSSFGQNSKSWVLKCNANKGYTFKHGGEPKNITGSQSNKIGVFLDHKAGFLSFYSISEETTLLHRVKTTFTQPLFAGLGVHFFGSSAKFCDIS